MKATDCIAIYAALVSSANLAWQWSSARRRIRVRPMFGLGRQQDPSVHVLCTNHGHKEVSLRAIGIVWPYRAYTLLDYARAFMRCGLGWRRRLWVHGEHGYVMDGQFPLLVAGGNSVGLDFPYEALRAKLKQDGADRVVFYVQDALGQNTYSEVFRFK